MFGKKMKTTSQSLVTFLPGEKKVDIGSNSTVLEMARSSRIPINQSCGGMGTCTTCRLIVEEAPEGCSPRTEIEQEQADDRGYKENERLACQLKPSPGMVVWIPNWVEHKKG